MEKEKRLIDANEFVKQLEEEFHGMVSDSELKVYQIISRIEEQPAVDAVEVVRCNDCRYSYCNKYCTNEQWKDTVGTVTIEADDFCSYGERKDND